MTTDTDRLIAAMADASVPVRRLRPPLWRAASVWLTALGLLTVLVLVRGVREDIGTQLNDPRVAFGLGMALLTSGLAAVAACMLALPDRSPRWLLLPLPALALWLGSVGYGCLTAWVSLDPGMVTRNEALRCLTTSLLCGVPISALVLMLLRRGMPRDPVAATLAGGLAASGVTAVALTLIHNISPSMMIVLWNVGVTIMLVAGQGFAGRRMLRPI
jgi:hypothetical protein